MSPAENVEVFLSRYEAAFTEEFRRVLAIEPPADAAYGQVWFQYDDTSEVLPLTLVWCDAQHGGSVPQPPLLTVATDQPWGPVTTTLDEAALDLLLFQWVRRCWQAAGGATSPVSFFAYNYHTMESFSLRRGCYVQESELLAPAET